MEIIIKRYEHINRSFRNWDTPKGKYIGSRKQYEEEMRKGGFVDYEKGEEIAKHTNINIYKGLSTKAEDVIKAAHLTSDKKGNIKPSGRLIDGMKEVGVKFDVPDWCPRHYMEA